MLRPASKWTKSRQTVEVKSVHKATPVVCAADSCPDCVPGVNNITEILDRVRIGVLVHSDRRTGASTIVRRPDPPFDRDLRGNS